MDPLRVRFSIDNSLSVYSMNISSPHCKEWILPIQAARELCISRKTLQNVAGRLGIRCREIPGRNGRLYNTADLQRAKARLEASEAACVAAAQQLVEMPRPPGRTRKNGTARAR